MKRLFCSIALAGFACAASAQLANTAGSGKTFAGQDMLFGAPQPASARSFNDAVGDTGGTAPRTDAGVGSGITSAIPEPQTYALLLAGLGAVVFVAVRRRRP
jgi:hypothetical protein